MLAIISKAKQQETGFKMLQETLKKGIGGGVDSLPSSGPTHGITIIKDS